MLLKLFLAFTIIPFTELYLLIKIGGLLGAFNTIVIVILTGFFGALLARFQGMQTMLRVRASLTQGEMPAEELLDALLIFLAGIVLLTPGFITDLAGIVILIPQTRFLFKKWLRKRFDGWMNQNRLNITF
ncbi:MAG: FxsA family protein [Deltaproteobacteria bacterium]|nr:FxsA family protein [Deltaproteobacteria bacterium]MBW1912090.1 FxsA family protein [Deltaproteobacteria bacterium]